jgi:hypothetical protein
MTYRNRYDVIKDIATIGPEWAKGCAECGHGIVSAPEITGAATFYLERLVQAVDGDITFCTCRAGTSYRVSLLKRHQRLVEEARKDVRMRESAERRSHPDIENARIAIATQRVPTIHAAEAMPEPEKELA